MDKKLKEAVIKLFLDNFEVLAMHPDQYGKTEVLEMRIDLVLGAIPYKSIVRPLNGDQKENLQIQIDEWLEQGVIEPSVSPWVLPLVLVKKKERRTRWVTDLKELNKQTIKDSYSLTNIHEILQSARCYSVFVFRCLWSSSHRENQIWEPPVHSVYQPLWHVPVYTMLFGLANTVSVYSRVLVIAMKEGDRDFWMSNLDDILTYSGEPWAHFGHLTWVVLAHAAAGIKIQPDKALTISRSCTQNQGG